MSAKRYTENLKGLYAISDSVLTPDSVLIEKCEKALKDGVNGEKINIFQYRQKTASDEDYLAKAVELARICAKFGVLFVVNDRVGVAVTLEKMGFCAGLHVGKDECASTRDLKKICQNFGGVIGVSCYGDLERAVSFQKAGADYVAFGSCFSSPTKPKAKVIDHEVLRKATELLNIPICAIGGINFTNRHLLPKTTMVAMISGVWGLVK